MRNGFRAAGDFISIKKALVFMRASKVDLVHLYISMHIGPFCWQIGVKFPELIHHSFLYLLTRHICIKDLMQKVLSEATTIVSEKLKYSWGQQLEDVFENGNVCDCL